MSIYVQIGMAFALAMDAFAVAICKGLTVKKTKPRHLLATGLYFGGFQAFMPLLGYLLARVFQGYVQAVDHWIAFVLLSIIGINMIKEAFSKDEEEHTDDFSPKAMLPLAVATSIDALAVGVALAVDKDISANSVYSTIVLIGVITCALSAFGVWFGKIVGCKFKSKAEFAGGVILIILGFKILLEDLNVITLPF